MVGAGDKSFELLTIGAALGPARLSFSLFLLLVVDTVGLVDRVLMITLDIISISSDKSWRNIVSVRGDVVIRDSRIIDFASFNLILQRFVALSHHLIRAAGFVLIAHRSVLRSFTRAERGRLHVHSFVGDHRALAFSLGLVIAGCRSILRGKYLL